MLCLEDTGSVDAATISVSCDLPPLLSHVVLFGKWSYFVLPILKIIIGFLIIWIFCFFVFGKRDRDRVIRERT
jgi:cellobiose-specific phosphotransferase system component IIC